jgi:hypothetical protein
VRFLLFSLESVTYPMAIFQRRTESDRAGRPWLGLADLGGILSPVPCNGGRHGAASRASRGAYYSAFHQPLTDDSCNQFSHLRLRKYVAFKTADYFRCIPTGKAPIDGAKLEMRLFSFGDNRA